MKRVKVRVTGSRIREKNTTKVVMDSLGLRKIGQIREYPMNDCVMGMIRKVNHLISYEIFEDKSAKPKAAPKKP
ncbi:50S ribosomal protein L30, partial [bacterium]|nr:50S ribosomal protein L30 [bacterium]